MYFRDYASVILQYRYYDKCCQIPRLEVSRSPWGEVRHRRIPRATQQLLCSKSHDFLAIFALAHSKINQIA